MQLGTWLTVFAREREREEREQTIDVNAQQIEKQMKLTKYTRPNVLQ